MFFRRRKSESLPPGRRARAALRRARRDRSAMLTPALAPRPLEPRRLLDGAGGVLALDAMAAGEEFVQAASVATYADSGDPPTANITVGVNNAPTDLQIAPIAAIDENGIAELQLTFADIDPGDTHVVQVDWGDGSPVESFNLSAGARSLDATHQYLDDNPTGTQFDVADISVTVTDNGGLAVSGDATVRVNNVAPSTPMFERHLVVAENGAATLSIEFHDPGTLDAHVVEIDWGDGSPLDTLAVPAGARELTASHQYLDDDPSGTTLDVLDFHVRVIDDDGGVGEQNGFALVYNLPPGNLQIDAVAPIDENGVATLHLTFDDPGTLDQHVVDIDWADGTPAESFTLPVGARELTATHQYLDDSPSGTALDTYAVEVRVRDDDLGAEVGSTTIQVRNVAPSGLVLAPPATIDENGVATLNLSFFDPGTQDLHTVQIDWGDGSPVQSISLAAGTRSLAAMHQYLDDNPSGTPADKYPISVTVVDDDGGMISETTAVTVRNVPPEITRFVVGSGTAEGDLYTARLEFADPGTVDVHTVEIDWGDGLVTTAIASGRSFTATHVYADNGTYVARARIVDDDTGADMASDLVGVVNVAPTLTVVGKQTIAEGSLLQITSIGTFTDPGFDNPLNGGPGGNGDEVAETFTYEINWGDGTAPDFGFAAVDSPGGPGTLTAGSFDGQHTYADNGLYTVEVRVIDDDGGVDIELFQVEVTNVAPTLAVAPDQTIAEGSLLQITDIGTFTDPGFDNPANTLDPTNGGEVEETFTYEINWGDGLPPDFGFATIDAAGSAGVLTAGSFNGQHTYADNGLYTVEVRVLDDDGGIAIQTFRVLVTNVDPQLTGTDALAVDEGQAFTLAGLGVGLTDPGFDNPANTSDPSNGSETAETFTGYTVDWGDGTTIDPLAVVGRVSGSAGTATTAAFAHAPHTYADNGVYTVTLRLADDDGPVVARTLQITVSNVDPTLTLTDEQFTLNEGETLTIPDLATFTDPGFDNLANTLDSSNGGETQELFTYTIDWGDGTPVESFGPGDMVRTSGSPGVETTGSFGGSHFYADNDADNKYTITVALADDDGGVDVRTIEVTVLNVNPTLDPIAATDVSAQGVTVLDLTFADPGADSFEVLVDWGDKLSLPPQDRFVVETVHAGPTPQSFTLSHKYNGPPDPLNPAADITIRVKIHDDDFGTPLVVQIGESNTEAIAISNPGEGKEAFYVDTTPQVPRLEFAARAEGGRFVATTAGVVQTRMGFDQRGAAGEPGVGAERFFELRVIYPDGTQSEGYRLPNDAISDIPALFRDLPDNHYAIYLVQPQTGSRRLVIEVFVRNGKLIDPGDDSEGARDRPPTDDAATPAEGEELPAADQTTDAGPVRASHLAASATTPADVDAEAVKPTAAAEAAWPVATAGLAISARGRAVLAKQRAERHGETRKKKLLAAARGGRGRPR